ncbi:MAG: hypothetical protein WBA44_02220 [Mesorhizobium sp.]
MIRQASNRRYGVEFYVAEIVRGAGVTGAITIGGVTSYLSAYLAFGPRAPAMTFHAYLRAIDAPVYLRWYAGQTFFKNGVAQTSHMTISPADGWVSVLVFDVQDPYTSIGYNPTPLTLHLSTPGDRCHMTCPALMGGLTQINPSIGVVAGINRWLP